MQGLWSMAAHMRACRCRTCLRATHSATRRVTTATAAYARNPRRRKVLASDVFTACYTAIMATAAVLDARRKDRRRRELDREIADARGHLASLMEESHARDLAKILESQTPYIDAPFSPPLGKLDVLNEICKLQPDYLRGLRPKRQMRQETVQQLRTMLGLSWNPELPETRKSTLARCEEVMMAEGKDPSLLHREPQTETQMTKFADMITDLVDRLQAEAYWISELEAPGSRPKPSSPDSAATMIRLLRSEGYPAYAHPNVDPQDTTEQRTRLNDVNLEILGQWARPWRERYVAKICYNLLVCGVPPGIQNYNMLILGFTLLGEHNLAQAVVDSLLFQGRLRPTEATYLCYLHHYRLKGDIVGFHGLLRRMFGHDPRGIGLMKRTADYVARYPDLRAWAATADVAAVNGHYVERAPLTQNVAEAVMEGLIDFDMLREAAKLLSVCLEEKWAISRDLLWRLFHGCLTLLDTAAAKMIIRALLDNIDQASSLLLGPDAVGPAVVRQLRHILNMWQATTLPGGSGNGGSGIDGHVSGGSMRRKSEMSKLDHLATAIWIRETGHHISMMSWWLRKAKQKLCASDDAPLGARLDSAMFVLGLAAERPRRKAEKTEHITRVAKMEWLMTQTLVSEWKIRNAETVLCNVLARQTPRALRSAAQFSPRVPIEERVALALPYGTPGTPEHEVALCFARSKEIDLQLKAALLEALPLPLARGLLQTRNDSGDVRLGRILAYFEQYLAGLGSQIAEEREMAESARADPLARLLRRLPRPSLAFWKRDAGATSTTTTAAAAATAAATPQ